MKTPKNHAVELFCFVLASILASSAHAEKGPVAIPFSQIGAKATADYHGNALEVTATTTGAQLHCAFQKLNGHATTQGLWLKSTAQGGGQLRLLATALGRGNASALNKAQAKVPTDDSGVSLAGTGTISVKANVVQFKRPGLKEEYSVSVNGVRQDFVILKRPAGTGELWVRLALTGAKAEATSYGAKLVLDGSDRALAYSRLRATDATGRQLKARLEVLSPHRLVVQVADAKAVYPLRIDPTFSDANWVSLNSGLPGAAGSISQYGGNINAISSDENGNLYIAGDFQVIGTVRANNIAKWNGHTWSALGSGVGGEVYSLAVSGTNIYAGGSFNTAGGVVGYNSIAKWDGHTWSALGSGIFGTVSAMAVSRTTLYVGGSFDAAGGMSATNIAKWNGSTWSALGSGVVFSPEPGFGKVAALAVSGSNLYVGGQFDTAGGVPATDVAEWDGYTWSSVQWGQYYAQNGPVLALAASGNNLYVGDYSGGVERMDQYGVWFDVGSYGLNSGVDALAVGGTNLYAGTGDGQVAKWDGAEWNSLGSGMGRPINHTFVYGSVNALLVSGTNVYAGGTFATAGGVSADNIAEWNGNTWIALAPQSSGLDDSVDALAVSGTNLYAAGAFLTADGISATNIAKWDGHTWSSLDSRIGESLEYSQVMALAISGTNLYLGGYFDTIGGISVNNIAKWDGHSWSALGSGIGGEVYSLGVSGTNLYAGGSFDTAGGTSATNIAKWDGHAWSALGSGLGGGDYNGPSVSALAVSDSKLYVGGDFTTAGGVSATNIAEWDGHTWSPLGLGIGGSVYALAISGTTLYAGGSFVVAKWDGNTWTALGSGVGGDIGALAISGTNLYAGGSFYTIGGVSANNIAKWNGSTWSAMGSGTDGAVAALAADNMGHLFVGGDFSVAGTNVSPFIAQANIAAVASGLVEISDIGVKSGAVTLDCVGVPATTYALERATDVQFTQNLTTLLTTNAPADGQFQFTDPNPPPTTAFYRLSRQ